jgi:chromate transporter
MAPAIDVFWAFLRLGISSFGGPIAHLGYFRAEFVERRRWLSEAAFGDLVGLCQFLPGPASSQAGFAIGLLRAGIWGGVAAWAGFTLPSALLMVVFAREAGRIGGSAAGAGVLHGLKLVAVAVVAQAVLGMARSLCPDRARAAIAVLAVWLVVLLPGTAGQVGAILAGGAGGILVCGAGEAVTLHLPELAYGKRQAVLALAVFFVLLAIAVVPVRGLGDEAVFGAFYRAGALVFGGGHVVLPLLRSAVVGPGWMSDSAFLAGYGAAQAVPGPLFTFAGYLGRLLPGAAGGLHGAVIALVAIFLPGLLLVTGVLPFWHAVSTRPTARAALRGANAAVVGVLGAALYAPVFVTSVVRPADFSVALSGFVLLTVWRAPPILVVAFGALAGAVLGSI